MEISNIRKKIGTSIYFFPRRNHWQMEFYVKIDGVNYPIYVYLHQNDILSYSAYWRLELSKNDDEKLLESISQSDAFLLIKRHIEKFEKECRENIEIKNAAIFCEYSDGYAVTFDLDYSNEQEKFELKDTYDETVSAFRLKNDENEHFLLYVRKCIKNDRFSFELMDKSSLLCYSSHYILTETDVHFFKNAFPEKKFSLFRDFSNHLCDLAANVPAIRLKLLTT